MSINLHKKRILNVILCLVGIKKRIGLVRKQGESFTFLKHSIVFDQETHHIIQYLRFAKDFVNMGDDYSLDYFPGDMQQIPLNFKRKYIVMCPGGGRNHWASMPNKIWPASFYQELINRLLPKYEIILIGDENDSRYYKETILEEANPGLYDYSSKLSLDEIFFLIQKATCYIGNDSFLLHFASTTQVRTIGLFGPTSAKLLAPLGENDFFIQSTFACSPCYDANVALLSKAYLCDNNKCMAEIRVEDVLALIQQGEIKQ